MAPPRSLSTYPMLGFYTDACTMRKELIMSAFLWTKPSLRRIETDLSWPSGTMEEDKRVRATQKTPMSSYEPFCTYLDHTRVDSPITSGAYPLSIVVTLVAFWPVLHVPMYTTYTSAKDGLTDLSGPVAGRHQCALKRPSGGL